MVHDQLYVALQEKQMKNVCKHMRVELVKPDQDKKLKRLSTSS
jgi:hypothetical protein